MIRMVLVDDTRMFRDGLCTIIDLEPDMQVVGVAGDGAAGLAVVRQQQPDVVLMDIRMPVMDGVEATRRLKAEFPHIHVVILTTFAEDEFIFDGLKAGAVAYLVKDLSASDLLGAIRTVRQGGALIPPAIAARLVAEYARLAAQGLSNREIAEQLYLSEGTVKNYVSAIFAKLHARDRAQAVAFALRQGLVGAP